MDPEGTVTGRTAGYGSSREGPSMQQRMVGRRTAIGLISAAGVSLLAACTAPAAPATSSKPAAGKPVGAPAIAAYQGADRQTVLEEGSRQENQLTWYTSLAGSIIDRITEGFRAKYPHVKTDVFRGAENELVTRATQEGQAGQNVFDVIESPPTAIRVLADGGLTTPYFSPAVERIGTEFKTPASGGLFESATVRVQFIGFGYNTTLIPETAVPSKTEDLMNPALTGKLHLAGSTTGKRWLGSVLKGMGDEKGRQWITELGQKQKPIVQQLSGKALMDLITKGEVPASPTIFEAELLQAAKGGNAPVKWVPLEPVVGNAGQAAVSAKAPHPHTALLFVDYLLADGQKVLQDNYYFTPGQQTAFTPWIPEQGLTTEQIQANLKLWDSLFNSAFLR